MAKLALKLSTVVRIGAALLAVAAVAALKILAGQDWSPAAVDTPPPASELNVRSEPAASPKPDNSSSEHRAPLKVEWVAMPDDEEADEGPEKGEGTAERAAPADAQKASPAVTDLPGGSDGSGAASEPPPPDSGSQGPEAETQPEEACRYPNLALVVKSSRDTVLSRIPLAQATWLGSSLCSVIVAMGSLGSLAPAGRRETRVGRLRVVDVVTDVYVPPDPGLPKSQRKGAVGSRFEVKHGYRLEMKVQDSSWKRLRPVGAGRATAKGPTAVVAENASMRSNATEDGNGIGAMAKAAVSGGLGEQQGLASSTTAPANGSAQSPRGAFDSGTVSSPSHVAVNLAEGSLPDRPPTAKGANGTYSDTDRSTVSEPSPAPELAGKRTRRLHKRQGGESPIDAPKRASNSSKAVGGSALSPTRTNSERDGADRNLDADTHIPAFVEAWNLWPDADWYVMVDDAAYVHLPTLSSRLLTSQLDPEAAHFFGSIGNFTGCSHELGGKVVDFGAYARGDAGIILSRGAVKRMVVNADTCMKELANCLAGDVRTSICLAMSGVNPQELTGLGVGSLGAGQPKLKWPASSPCDPVIAVRNVSEAGVRQLQAVSDSLPPGLELPFAGIFDILSDPPAKDLVAKEEGTLRMGAVRWASEVGHVSVKADGEPKALKFSSGGTGTVPATNVLKDPKWIGARAALACHAACVAEARCVSWTLAAGNGPRNCSLLSGIPPPVGPGGVPSEAPARWEFSAAESKENERLKKAWSKDGWPWTGAIDGAMARWKDNGSKCPRADAYPAVVANGRPVATADDDFLVALQAAETAPEAEEEGASKGQ